MPMRGMTEEIEAVPALKLHGRVAGARGLTVEIAGPIHAMTVGGRVTIEIAPGRLVQCEVVGFERDRALALPFGALEGVRRGCKVQVGSPFAGVRPSGAWLGRVVNAHQRRRVGSPLDLGVRALNAFATCCRGQRMGIFAGSGVGKSVLLAMLARNVASGVSVIGLVGERGREVQEFLQDDLGEEGLSRAVVVVATSDEPALMRRQAAYLTLSLAEFFRDEGRDVLCMIDSVTRFAMAQREIGLSAGEPPTAKGYTPTVFSELPKLLERAGPGTGEGTITGVFTVLVDGDDHNEPVADAVRGILDGHIVMERGIAERGRYPAVNVLKTVSRTMPRSTDPQFVETVRKAKQIMATFADMEELIRLGAYRQGSSPEVDEAIRLNPAFEAFLRQGKEEFTSLRDGYLRLAEILSGRAA
jgi:flagellum-specific ATP synthase